ncbi:MAG: hypothetical protein PWR20_861 [Bacteroidales bacterium]|jgi:lycopene cyclase domain-containing protein|nr:hypothetical protein [Bacteroidales bacterium]MDN5329584.1 hypothetical protein [Bacteroidales bacterium]
MLTYLLINLSVVLIPFLFSFDRKVAFYTRWKFVLPAIILGTIPFIAWDIWFAHEGYWGFTDSYILGTRFLGLPLEEWLFFLAIPYAGIFSYDVMNYYFPKDYTDSKLCKAVCLTIALLTFFFLALGRGGLYSVISFSLVLIIMALVFLVRNLRPFTLRFIRFYLVLLVPFILVNGILTGMFLDQPIVWYNPEAILGLRIITIPVEDIFFGMALMYFILFIYEALQHRLDHQKV